MVCTNPKQGYLKIFPNGKRKLVFSNKLAEDFCLGKKRFLEDSSIISIPCGQCLSCRIDRSREWGVRCYHESQLWSENSFVTLTFNDDSLKFMCPNGSLDKRHVQLFLKDLRYRFGSGVRVFYCGEYGGKLGRPHYHLLLFNCGFYDKKPFKSVNGHLYYRSSVLEELWPYGFSTIGDVSYISSAYVARYVTKKIFGRDSREHYGSRLPEFCQASLRPGIGSGWFDRYGMSDLFPRDECVVRSDDGVFRCRMPRFYDKRLEQIDSKMYADVKAARLLRAMSKVEDNTYDRLKVKEKLFAKRINDLVRILEV